MSRQNQSIDEQSCQSFIEDGGSRKQPTRDEDLLHSPAHSNTRDRILCCLVRHFSQDWDSWSHANVPNANCVNLHFHRHKRHLNVQNPSVMLYEFAIQSPNGRVQEAVCVFLLLKPRPWPSPESGVLRQGKIRAGQIREVTTILSESCRWVAFQNNHGTDSNGKYLSNVACHLRQRWLNVSTFESLSHHFPH